MIMKNGFTRLILGVTGSLSLSRGFTTKRSSCLNIHRTLCYCLGLLFLDAGKPITMVYVQGIK